MDTITAISNSKVQWLKSLINNKKARDVEGLYIAEGGNLVKDLPLQAIDSYCLTQSGLDSAKEYIDDSKNIILVSDTVMASISDTRTPSGILAVCRKSNSAVDCLSVAVVADSIADPGNLGTIIRTMIACGVNNLLLFGDCVDVYSPKVVRATMGGIAKLNIAKLVDANILPYEKILTLDMKGKDIFTIDKAELGEQFALVVGSESKGLSQEFRNPKYCAISLPMKGVMESLNAGISLSVALYQLIFG